MDTLTTRAAALRSRAHKIKTGNMLERMNQGPAFADDLADFLVDLAQAVEGLQHA